MGAGSSVEYLASQPVIRSFRSRYYFVPCAEGHLWKLDVRRYAPRSWVIHNMRLQVTQGEVNGVLAVCKQARELAVPFPLKRSNRRSQALPRFARLVYSSSPSHLKSLGTCDWLKRDAVSLNSCLRTVLSGCILIFWFCVVFRRLWLSAHLSWA